MCRFGQALSMQNKNTFPLTSSRVRFGQFPLGIQPKTQQHFVRSLNYDILKSKRKSQILCAVVQKETTKKTYRKKETALQVRKQKQKIAAEIDKCVQLEQLQKVLEEEQNSIEFVNVGLATSALIRIILSQQKTMLDSNRDIIDSVCNLLFQQMLRHSRDMDTRTASYCLWSLGKLSQVLKLQETSDYKLTVIFKVLCNRVLEILQFLNTREASIILWAMARCNWSNRQQIDMLYKQAVIASEAKSSKLSVKNIIWSMGFLRQQNNQITAHFVTLAKKYLGEMNGQDIADIMWALRYVRYYDEELLVNIEQIIVNQKVEFDNADTTRITQAFSNFGLKNKDEIIQLFVDKVLSRPGSLQSWIGFIHSLALLDCPVDYLQKVLNEFVSQKVNSFGYLKSTHLKQLQETKVFYDIRKQELTMPKEIQQKGKEIIIEQHQEKISENSIVNTVFEFLSTQFDNVQKHVFVFDDQILIDVVVQQDGSSGDVKKIAVIAHARSSYFRNDVQKLNGRRQFYSDVILPELGWKVVNVNANLWDNVENQEKLVEEIKQRLQE